MSRKFLSPINLPQGTALPSSGLLGDCFYVTTTNSLYIYNGTAWTTLNVAGPLTYTAATQALGINASVADTANYVVQRDSTGQTVLGGMTLDTAATPTNTTGTFRWNTGRQTADLQLNSQVSLQLGQEVHIYVRNTTANDIPDGTPVAATGVNADTITVAPFLNDGTIDHRYFMGITTQAIPKNTEGMVTYLGEIHGQNTSGWTVGTELFVSSTGTLTATQPAAPAFRVPIAYVTRSNVSNGILLVRVNNGIDLDQVGQVNITSPANNQALRYDTASSQWKNKAITGIITAADTAPSSPNPGDAWYDTSVGNIYVYFNDGNSSQWVEIQNNSSTATVQEMPAGTILPFAGTTAPPNYLICDGSAVSRTAYASLYAVIGTTYGAGDGATTFNIPDLRGRVAVGKNSGTFSTLGASGGAETVTLTEAQMPAHNHNVMTNLIHGDGTLVNDEYINASLAAGTARRRYNNYQESKGGGQAHNNLQPYIVTNYIIKHSVGAATGDSQLATRVGSVESRTTNLEAKSPNYIINGAFDIWQRGTSGAVGGTMAYTADRWQSLTYSGGTTTWSQQAAGTNGAGARYCMRVQRASGATFTATTNLAHSLETSEVARLAGKTVTLSWYARAGANYSPAGSVLSYALTWGTGTDQAVYSGSGITGGADIVRSTVTINSSWQRFTYTGSVPSTATSLGINIYSGTNVGTAGASDYFEVTGLQLEEGMTATPFRRNANSLQGELAACQRYYYRWTTGGGQYLWTGIGFADGSTSAQIGIQFPVTMRTAVGITPESGGTWVLIGNGGSYTVTSFAQLTTPFMGNQSSVVYAVVASGLTINQTYSLRSTATNSYLGFSAEL